MACFLLHKSLSLINIRGMLRYGYEIIFMLLILITLRGKTDVALNCIRCLMRYFANHRQSFTKIIDGKVNPDNVMQRPHIRFNGADLTKIEQDWQHAQNDALGYFLWFYCRLIADQVLPPSFEELEILTLFPLYFGANRLLARRR